MKSASTLLDEGLGTELKLKRQAPAQQIDLFAYIKWPSNAELENISSGRDSERLSLDSSAQDSTRRRVVGLKGEQCDLKNVYQALGVSGIRIILGTLIVFWNSRTSFSEFSITE